MAMISVKSSVTGEISIVSESAYNSFLKDLGIYTIIKEDKKSNTDIKENVSEVVDDIQSKPKKPQKQANK